jgi:FixJ family two-component response regulator
MAATSLVAVVDDDEGVRRALARLIRSAGLDADTFPSGDEFLETLCDHRPDCIVLDLHMPKVSGLAVQSWLGKAGVRIPVIVVTGHDTPETQAQVMKAGAVAYFRKPVDGEALLDAISTAIADRRKGED